MSPHKFRHTKDKTLYFYCFWKQQYMDRNSGKLCDGDSTRFIVSISRGNVPKGQALDWNILAGTALKKCTFVEACASSVTLRIARDADDEMILRAVRVWRCYKPSQNGKQGYIVSVPSIFTHLHDVAERSIEINPDASFNPNQWASRALGLWIWDYVQERGGTIIAAIRAMKEQLGPEVEALGFAASEENVFRRFYRKTAECIDACEVLPFK